jgi:DNA repair protein RecO (recombination protein O)
VVVGLFKAEGIVLKGKDYREADQLLTILTPAYGRVEAIVKGVRKPHSKLRSGTQQLCRSRFMFYAGKNLATITQCEVQSIFAPLRQDLTLLAYAYYLLEIADVVALPGQAAAEIYYLLKYALELLATVEPDLVARAFEARTLKILGLEPRLDFCAACQGLLADASRVVLAPAAGGALCRSCQGQHGTEYYLLPGSIKIWQHLNRLNWRHIKRLQVSPLLGRQLREIMPAFLEYYLDRRIRSRGFISEIGGDSHDRTGKD